MVMSNGYYTTERSNGNSRTNGVSENHPSLLLNSQENDVLFDVIGSRCTSLASAVVQVLFADPSSPGRWRRELCGVACFIKDNPKKSFFIRILDIVDRLVLWEQELYHEMNYTQTLPYFHTFETDNRQAALNFANEDEASYFYAMVHEKVELLHRKNRDNQRRRAAASNGNLTSGGQLPVKSHPQINHARSPQRQEQVSTAHSVQVPFPTQNSERTTSRGSIAPAATHSVNNGDVGAGRSYSKKSAKNKRITKQDIGLPSNFVHISHIGWDPDKGFDYDDSDPTLQELFRKAGIDMRKADAATRSFIYGFIEKELGGVNAVKKAVHPPAPPAPSQPPPPPRSQPRNNPPPVPTTPPQAPTRAPPRQARAAQPVAPPPPPPPPAPPSAPLVRGQAPVVPSNIPPPPPPPSAGFNAPTERNGDVANSAMEEVDSRSALMDSIRKGRELKKVEVPSAPQVALSGRDKLMNDITSGVHLKHVDPEKTSLGKSDSGQQLDGMAAALARALAQRRGALEFEDGSDDNKDDGSDEEDDWD